MTDVSDVGNYTMIQYLHDFFNTTNEIGKRGVREHDAATAYIFSLDFSAILLVRKRFSGRLMPPGGHIDDGESCLGAVLRETREETKIDTSLLKRVHFSNSPSKVNGELEVIPAEYDEEFIVKENISPLHIHRDHIYCFQYPIVFEKYSIKNAEIKEVLWVDINSIKKEEFYPNVYRTIIHFYLQGRA